MTRSGKIVPLAPRPASYTTEVQAGSHQGGRKRLLWAGVAALAGLALLVLFGPDEQTIKERFEYYGAPGQLEIMPEISIEEGYHKAHQIPRSLQVEPPPARIEIEKNDPSKDGTEEIPPVNLQDPNEVERVSKFPRDNAEMSVDQQVEMAMPRQSNPDWYILNLVRPEYPLGASETDRRIRVITVKVAIFVGPDGLVTDAMVRSNDGSRLFEVETIKAVKQWKVGWRVNPGIGRWYNITWRFKSPYFTR